MITRTVPVIYHENPQDSCQQKKAGKNLEGSGKVTIFAGEKSNKGKNNAEDTTIYYCKDSLAVPVLEYLTTMRTVPTCMSANEAQSIFARYGSNQSSNWISKET